MPEAALGFGSNLGDKRAHIEQACDALFADGAIRLLRRSAFYRTEPWGDEDQDWFANCCALIETDLSPRSVLERCLAAERAIGRARDKARRWGPRIIDIDLLFYENEIIDEPDLILPHPRLLERAFVLVPLAEIAPDRMIGDVRIADATAAVDGPGVERWDR